MSNKTDSWIREKAAIEDTCIPTAGNDEPWPKDITKGSHTILTFPVGVEQVGPRKVAIPTLPVDFNMFHDGFEHMVMEMLGRADGEAFLQDMVRQVSRKLMIAQIR